MGNAAASAGAAGPFYGTTGRRKQRVATAELSVLQDLPRTTGRPGAVDAAVDSTGATAVPARDYGPGRIRRMVMPECTAASGRHDHATFRERADESVSLMLGIFWAKLLHANRPTGIGPGSQVTGSSSNPFYATPA